MIEIDDKIIGTDVLTARFCCDIAACKGECCVDGNSGAPLDDTEDELLRQSYHHYKKYMKPEGVQVIEKEGFSITDFEGDLTTPLINEAECAYSINENGSTWCAIEKAWSLGQCSYRKPISCHLYPIRLVKLNNGFTGLQYHRWSICRAAEIKGCKDGIPVYQTVKDALIRRFGSDFYDQLLDAIEFMKQEDELHNHSNS